MEFIVKCKMQNNWVAHITEHRTALAYLNNIFCKAPEIEVDDPKVVIPVVKQPAPTDARQIVLYCLLGIVIVVVVGGFGCFVWKKNAAPLQMQNKDAQPNAMRDLEEGWKYRSDHHGPVVEEIELQDLKP
eukprot:972595_1